MVSGDKISNLLDVWDNGAVGNYFLSGDDIDEFKARTSATRVVAYRWTYREITYETTSRVELLPDGAGLVYGDRGSAGGNNKLIVLNGDNTIRCEIIPPALSVDASRIDPAVYQLDKKDPRTARPFLVYPSAPEVSAALRPQKRNGRGSLALPQPWNPDAWCGISYGCQGEEDSDGDPYVFEFDWYTGTLLKAAHSPRTW